MFPGERVVKRLAPKLYESMEARYVKSHGYYPHEANAMKIARSITVDRWSGFAWRVPERIGKLEAKSHPEFELIKVAYAYYNEVYVYSYTGRFDGRNNDEWRGMGLKRHPLTSFIEYKEYKEDPQAYLEKAKAA